MEQKRQVYVIGAGAAGMVAAICARRNGYLVTILESTNQSGKKILMTGNGKCNLSNRYFSLDCYQNGNKKFLKEVFVQFDVEKTCQFFEDLGLFITEKDGYLYPNSKQASSVAKILTEECKCIGIKTIYQEKVVEIKRKGKQYLIYGTQEMYHADDIILATGSKAYPKTGSDGSGYALLEKLGCKMVPPLPALTALKCKEKYCKNFAGVRVQGHIQLKIQGKKIAEETGEIQLTDYGISGIPVFQISRYASRALAKNKDVTVLLDFMPDYTFQDLLSLFEKKIERYPKKTISEQFLGVLNEKLALVILESLNLRKNTESVTFSNGALKKIISKMKQFELHVIGTNGYDQSQICCGGLSLDEVKPETLELKKYPGIYVAGEILDVDGICGGYNLQWAWSSGYVAGLLQKENKRGKKK